MKDVEAQVLEKFNIKAGVAAANVRAVEGKGEEVEEKRPRVKAVK